MCFAVLGVCCVARKVKVTTVGPLPKARTDAERALRNTRLRLPKHMLRCPELQSPRLAVQWIRTVDGLARDCRRSLHRNTYAVPISRASQGPHRTPEYTKAGGPIQSSHLVTQRLYSRASICWLTHAPGLQTQLRYSSPESFDRIDCVLTALFTRRITNPLAEGELGVY